MDSASAAKATLVQVARSTLRPRPLQVAHKLQQMHAPHALMATSTTK